MHREVRRLLVDDAATLPATTLDVRIVIRRARRIRRRRRIAAATSAFVVLALIVLVARSGLGRQTSAAVSGTPAASTAAPHRFDPLVRTLQIGWRPAGLTAARIEITRYRQTYRATTVGSDGRTATGTLVVSALAVGRSEDTDPQLPPVVSTQATRPVAGHAARCLLFGSDTGCSALRWEYAPDAYATAVYRAKVSPVASADPDSTAPSASPDPDGPNDSPNSRDTTRPGSSGPNATKKSTGPDGRAVPAERAAMVRRVAASVSLSANTPVTAPFRITGPSAGLVPVRSAVEPADRPGSGTGWSVTLELANASDPADITRITAGGPGPPHVGSEAINTSIDGRPAHLDAARLTVYEAYGVRIAITLHRRADADPSAVYADLRVPAVPTDTARWTVPLAPTGQPR